jgi:uncharacterized protein (DUF1778 family)
MKRSQPRKTPARKVHRLQANVSLKQKRLIERAATLRGVTEHEFVAASAVEAASKMIQDLDVLHLGDEAREVFVDAILSPSVPNRALRAAANRYEKRMFRRL